MINDFIFFITPDCKRALGLELVLPNYHIICTYTDPLIPVLRNQGAKIFCLEEEGEDINLLNNTGKILSHPKTQKYIQEKSSNKSKIAFFKPSLKIDLLLKKFGFEKVGNNSELNEMFENKVKVLEVLKNIIPENLIPQVTGRLGGFEYEGLIDNLGKKFVVQFGHGWAGKSTHLIEDKTGFDNLRGKFPDTLVKISKFIEGITVLNNGVIYEGNVLLSCPALQINGIKELSNSFGVTCGRQWFSGDLNKSQIEEIDKISRRIGQYMVQKNYKGYFGIDFIIEKVSGKIYFEELNARLTASSSFYTKLELGLGVIPLIAYHLAAFTGDNLKVKDDHKNKIEGSQIILRRNYPNTPLDRLDNFGIYNITNFKKIAVDFYDPGNLGKKEFIVMKRLKTPHMEEVEVIRIETKERVLDNPRRLSEWVRRLILPE